MLLDDDDEELLICEALEPLDCDEPLLEDPLEDEDDELLIWERLELLPLLPLEDDTLDDVLDVLLAEEPLLPESLDALDCDGTLDGLTNGAGVTGPV